MKVYVHPSKKRNNECGPAWKTRRARPEAHICGALSLGKGTTLTIEPRRNSCTLQATLSMQGVIQRFPGCEKNKKVLPRLRFIWGAAHLLEAKDTLMSDTPIELDVRRLLCPMPVIKTQNKVRTLATGDTLKVVCTDPGALSDIPAWCRINGHEVLEMGEQGNEVFVVLRVGEDNGALF